ncbi:MAG: hypothetical protein ABGX16_15945 [Pirellulales bacterium]
MMGRQKLTLLVLMAASPLWLDISSTRAILINISNSGFEDISGETPVNEFTCGPPNGWDLYDPGVITGGGAGGTYFIGTLTPFEPDPIGNPGVFANFPAGAAEGQRVAIAFNFQGSDGQGEYGMVATLGDTLQANTIYMLSVEIGNIDSATSTGGSFFDLRGLPGYRVDLLAGVDLPSGGVIVAQDNNSLFEAINDGEFLTSTVTLTTGSAHPQLGQTLGIRLVNLNQIGPAFPDSDLEVDFDNVRLDAVATIAGNFDQDDDIDGADLLIFQRGFTNLFDVGDFVDWETNFSSALPLTALAQVPEPTTLCLLFSAALLTFFNGLRPMTVAFHRIDR